MSNVLLRSITSIRLLYIELVSLSLKPIYGMDWFFGYMYKWDECLWWILMELFLRLMREGCLVKLRKIKKTTHKLTKTVYFYSREYRIILSTLILRNRVLISPWLRKTELWYCNLIMNIVTLIWYFCVYIWIIWYNSASFWRNKLTNLTPWKN